MRLAQVDQLNKSLIDDFCRLAGSSLKTFRYFESRSVDIIKDHLVTYAMIVDDIPIGYGHLDFEDNTVWLAVCIIEGYTGHGYGKKMMDALISYALKSAITEINLSVDKENIPAVTMYNNMGFVSTHMNEKVYFMKLKLGETDG